MQRFLFFGGMILFVVSMVLTANANYDDGRINVGPHVGGHAVYCLDASDQPSQTDAKGGIKILSTFGNELVRVDGAALNGFITAVQAGEGNQLAASVPDPYGFGDLQLWVLSNGDFAVTGFDEHGKAFDFVWQDCTPVVYGSGGGGVVTTEEP